MASYTSPPKFADLAVTRLTIETPAALPLQTVVLIDGKPYRVYHRAMRGIDDYEYKLYRVDWRGEYQTRD